MENFDLYIGREGSEQHRPTLGCRLWDNDPLCHPPFSHRRRPSSRLFAWFVSSEGFPSTLWQAGVNVTSGGSAPEVPVLRLQTTRRGRGQNSVLQAKCANRANAFEVVKCWLNNLWSRYTLWGVWGSSGRPNPVLCAGGEGGLQHFCPTR